jgi:hypothetical protein
MDLAGVLKGPGSSTARGCASCHIIKNGGSPILVEFLEHGYMQLVKGQSLSLN